LNFYNDFLCVFPPLFVSPSLGGFFLAFVGVWNERMVWGVVRRQGWMLKNVHVANGRMSAFKSQKKHEGQHKTVHAFYPDLTRMHLSHNVLVGWVFIVEDFMIHI